MTTDASTDDGGLDAVDLQSTPSRDAVHFRAIVAASRDVKRAERALHAAVADARRAGDSWTVIGAALGITKQAAQQRFRSV